MLSYINRLKGLNGDEMDSGTTSSDSSSNSSQDSRGDPKNGAILYVPALSAKKKKHQSPQEAIDEFWSKFNSRTPGRASSILPKGKLRIAWERGISPKDISDRSNSKHVGEKVPRYPSRARNAVASYAEAATICKAKVEKIVKECRRVNQKYRDPHFDIEFDLKWGTKDCLTMLGDSATAASSFSPGSVKRVGDIFDEPEFYKGGATANDIRQGRDGDCWLMAALCTLGNKPGLIEDVCVARDEEVGVYGFVFFRDGEWISEIIDDKLYLTKPDYDESWIERNLIEDRKRINSEEDYRRIYQTGSGALYFAQCEDPNETWLPLLEKAYAKAHGDYAAIEGGFTGEGLEDLTGGVTTEISSTDILDKEYFWREELSKVNKDFLFGCGASLFWGRGERKGIVEGHAYSIMRAVEMDGKRLCLLRNPWGAYEWNGPWSDGSKEWTPDWMQKLEHRFGDDGTFWMSYEDLLKKYQTFDRTRLFGDDWKVTQQWTSLTVPWTTDYHSTKFSFTLEKKAPVVLVLSQLDTRYFCGLEGQYSFQLSFRVHKAGEEDYIVRSHGNYSMRRSVTAELELEPGEYHVLMRVEAEKNDHALPVEEVLRNNVKARKNKLLRIGLAYDLAHAKGQIKETDEERKVIKELEAKKKAKERKEMKDKLIKEKKRRKHVENKETRKTREATSKRKAKAKAKEEKKIAEEKEEKEENEENEKQKKEPEEVKEKVKEKGCDATKTDSPEKVAGPETGHEEKSLDNSTNTKPIIPNELETSPAVQESKPASTVEKKPRPAPPSNTDTSSITGPSALPPKPDDDEDDDLSDLNSVVSDISTGVVDEAIAEARLAAMEVPASTADDEEDDFEMDPWNAVAVVGLRVYSKESMVSIKVVREKYWEGAGEPMVKIGNGETKLDVDDSALDAMIGKEEEDLKPEIEEKEQVNEKEKKGGDNEKPEDTQKTEEAGEGSVVIV